MFPSEKAVGSFRRGSLLEESLLIIILGVVDILELESILFSTLSPEKDKDKASGEGFLEAEEAKTFLEKHLAIS